MTLNSPVVRSALSPADMEAMDVNRDLVAALGQAVDGEVRFDGYTAYALQHRCQPLPDSAGRRRDSQAS